MNLHPTSRPTPSRITKQLGLCLGVLASTAIMATQAQAVVVTFNLSIPVPNTFAGVYVNLATGANNPVPASVPGWDFGPWGSSNTLSFFFPGTPANSHGAVASTTTGPYLNLPLGSVISAASTFSASAANTATTAFQSTGTRIMGFRFFNESTAAINYGYMTIETTGPLGFPATIRSWSFENNGGAITVVPEPSTYAMLSLGVLALGAMVRRNRRQQGTMPS